MASLVAVPLQNHTELNDPEDQLGDITEFVSTFRTEPDTFISNNDKLHHWAMWRTHVNSSFIRNLPVERRNHLALSEDEMRQRRIDINRFLVHSDTDDIRRLQMKELYGNYLGYPTRLGHSTFFLYGLPRILIRDEPQNKVYRQALPEEKPEPVPTEPKKKTYLFVGAAQDTNARTSEEEIPLDLSHAKKKTSVFVTKQVPASAFVPVAPPEPLEQTEYEIWKKTHLIKDRYDDMSIHEYSWENYLDLNEDNISDSSSFLS